MNTLKLFILDPVPAVELPSESYVVEIETMIGDGDGYPTSTLGPFKKNQDEASLQSLLETLKRMKEEHPYGMCGSDRYDMVFGFEQWFPGDDGNDYELLERYSPKLIAKYGKEALMEVIELSKDHYGEWKDDITTDGYSPEQLLGYKVFYYDKNGVKYNVEYVDDETPLT